MLGDAPGAHKRALRGRPAPNPIKGSHTAGVAWFHKAKIKPCGWEGPTSEPATQGRGVKWGGGGVKVALHPLISASAPGQPLAPHKLRNKSRHKASCSYPACRLGRGGVGEVGARAGASLEK